jgi:hypothetical protein
MAMIPSDLTRYGWMSRDTILTGPQQVNFYVYEILSRHLTEQEDKKDWARISHYCHLYVKNF